MHLLNWDAVCQSKEKGGLGLQKLRILTKSLLMKWHWRWVHEDAQALWKRGIEQKYGVDMSGWSNLRAMHSIGFSKWNNIQKSRDDFLCNSRVNIRDGTKAEFWYHIWAAEIPLALKYPALHLGASGKEHRVADMVNLIADNNWYIPMRRTRPKPEELLEFESLIAEVRIPLLTEREDDLLWVHEGKTQVFSVRAQCQILQAQFARSNNLVAWDLPVKIVWNSLIPPKICFFVWSCCINRILTSARLRRLGMIVISRCPLCRCAEESQTHLLLNYSFAIQIWNQFRRYFSSANWDTSSCLAAIKSWNKAQFNSVGNLIWECLPHAVLWSIWCERNQRCFEDKERGIDNIVLGIRKLL